MTKFDILNRFSGAIQFTAEIDCSDDTPLSTKLGRAVKWGVTNKSDLSGVDLSGVDLSGVDLAGVDLSGADLSGANLSRVDLAGVDLAGANLAGVDLAGANLSWANLSWANLSRVDLSGADLSGANLSRVDLAGVDLAGANLAGANLSWANLSRAGLRVIGGRSDGHQFYLHKMPEGPPMLRAGCRFFTLAAARAHWTARRAGTLLGDESLALCDHAERMAKIAGWL